MPRLRADQWKDIKRRLLAGESGRALAREYGVTEGAVRQKAKPECDQARAVAHKVHDAEQELRSLPPSTQNYARSFLDELRAVSASLVSHARVSSDTAARLATLANAQVEKINPVDPMDTQEVMQGISALSKMSNEAAALPLALLNANRARLGETPDASAAPTVDFGGAPVEVLEWLAGRDGPHA